MKSNAKFLKDFFKIVLQLSLYLILKLKDSSECCSIRIWPWKMLLEQSRYIDYCGKLGLDALVLYWIYGLASLLVSLCVNRVIHGIPTRLNFAHTRYILLDESETDVSAVQSKKQSEHPATRALTCNCAIVLSSSLVWLMGWKVSKVFIWILEHWARV